MLLVAQKPALLVIDKGGDWSFADLDLFLASPKGFAKGTKMSFAGLKKASDRAAVLVYLQSLSTTPKPLP
jgi:cytochrome c